MPEKESSATLCWTRGGQPFSPLRNFTVSTTSQALTR